MSYDMMVFTPGVPPADRLGFIAWFSQVVRLRDGHMVNDPSLATPELAAWHQEMSRLFPPVATVRFTSNTSEEVMAADYRFAPDAIFARFDWQVSRNAYRRGLKLARQHQLGFFDASGDFATVWNVNGSGLLQVAHRGETMFLHEQARIRA